MQFLQPIMLLALGLIPLILLIHALKPKPNQIDVTNLFLWEEVLKERSRNVALNRLRRNLPLLLQILTVILAALALAKPVWLYFTQQQGNLILVIDTSASMQTKRGLDIRFDLAREKALEVIDHHESNQKILMIEAGSEPGLTSGFLDNPAQAKDLIKNLQPSDAPGKLEKAIYLALSFVDPGQDDTLYLITDGAGVDFANLVKIHPKIKPILIFGGAKNIGITKFEFREAYDRPFTYEIMVEIENFTPSPIKCPVQLSVDKTMIVDNNIPFEAHEKKLLILPYSGLVTGIAKANLEIEDDFTVDNTAYLSFSTSKDLWILLVSQGNYFLEKLLEIYPNVLLNMVKEINLSSWKTQVRQHDLIIIDRMDFPATDVGNFLVIDGYSPSIPLVKTGQIDFPEILDWNKQSPLMADVDISELHIEQAAKFRVDPMLQPVIESSQTGLMYTYQKGGLRAVILGFDITRSDLPLKVAYPVMMSNIINWLNPNKLSFSALYTKAGEPYNILLNPQTTEFSTRTPYRKWEKHQVTSNPFTYRDTNTVGIYTILENDKTHYFTVNLVDESESNITVPDFDVSAIPLEAPLDIEKITIQQPLWIGLLLLGLVVMVLEWHFWLKTE